MKIAVLFIVKAIVADSFIVILAVICEKYVIAIIWTDIVILFTLWRK